MSSFSSQSHLWTPCLNSLSTRKSQLFSELPTFWRDPCFLKAWLKFLHPACDFVVVVVAAVLFDVLPKQYRSLLGPPLFNISWVLMSLHISTLQLHIYLLCYMKSRWVPIPPLPCWVSTCSPTYICNTGAACKQTSQQALHQVVKLLVKLRFYIWKLRFIWKM